MKFIGFLLVLSLAALPARADDALPTDVPQDTCLACHLDGGDAQSRDIWLPLLRWLAFGAAGAVLAAGVWRSASRWLRRARGPWADVRDYLDKEYNLTGIIEQIRNTPPVPLWPARAWLRCLGGLSVLLCIVQAVTGVMLAFYYKPVADINPATSLSYAYESIIFIMEEAQFGALVRTVHHWSAALLIVLCTAHMAHVFLKAAAQRAGATWRIGVALLILTLGFGFTGYLLPWDQRAFWATTVGSDIAGHLPALGGPALVFLRDGWTVTGRTLQRFYGLHVFVLPLLTVALLRLHLRRQRFWAKIALPQARQWQIVVVLIVAGALALYAFAPLTLDAPADPLNPPEAPKPEWYFLFLYEFVRRTPRALTVGATPVLPLGPTFSTCVPVLALGLLFLAPALDRRKDAAARRRRVAVVIVCLAVFVILTIGGAA